LIGVLCKESERNIAQEFFELFKTPWEFYVEDKMYNVVLSTKNIISEPKAKLIVIYSHGENQIESLQGINRKVQYHAAMVSNDYFEIPIYGDVCTFEGEGQPVLKIIGSSEVTGVKIIGSNGMLIRIGYDIFEEVSFLIKVGQPKEKAHIPTLEIHISMLRNWILEAGIPIVEIPAIPAGYNFTVCLTHDVDFIKISQHKFDHTLMGFIYRALISSLRGFLTGRFPLRKLLKNYKAVLSLPFIYLGFIKDFWFEFDRYIEIEKEVKSTFFIIPFKNRAGKKVSSKDRNRRATRYDIDDIRDVVQKLIHSGFEIGLHGIDAWHSSDLAYEELKRIVEVTGQSELGIRIHWLCFDEGSSRILDEVGFLYDTTIGYNEAIGYRAGTTQVFQPSGVKNLLELPHHIQDIALLSPNQRGSTEKQAWEQCNNMFHIASEHGGVLTILWHIRSLAPERLWEDFYIRLLSELKNRNVWFATVSQAVKWFRMRRTLIFESASFLGNKFYLSLKSDAFKMDPKFIIRVHLPENLRTKSGTNDKGYIDIPWNGSKEVEIYLN
jgi:peptidoglycan/xylan/chitin deacetylase (PgdA/CDA1 family)